MAGALIPRERGPLLPAKRSEKSYAVAVVLSGIFGIFGVQHFYLRRWGEGILDVGLTAAWLYAFAVGSVGAGIGFFALDLLHTIVVTYLLLAGKFRDGSGKIVAYPGQKLDGEEEVPS